MASQVLSGTGNVSYTNNTGQNVRIIINYIDNEGLGNTLPMVLSWAGVSLTQRTNAFNTAYYDILAFGRNLAWSGTSGGGTSTVGAAGINMSGGWGRFPTELMIAPGQTFSATNISKYNIVVIPEAG